MEELSYIKGPDCLTVIEKLISGFEWVPNGDYAIYSCLRLLKQSFNAEMAVIYLLDKARENLLLYALEKERRMLDEYQVINVSSYQRIPQFEHELRSIIIPDCDDPDDMDFMPKNCRRPAWGVVIPIVMKSTLFGFANLQFTVSREQGEEPLRLFDVVGRILGIQLYYCMLLGAPALTQPASESTASLHASICSVDDDTCVSSTLQANGACVGSTQEMKPGLGRPLTQREALTLKCIADGKSDEEIARMLYVSESTVKKDVRNILAKLKAKNRTQAAVIAVTTNMLSVEDSPS